MNKMVKKLVVLILTLMLILANKVYAVESFSIKLTQDKISAKPGETVTINVVAHNINLEDGLLGLEGIIEYDDKVFKEVKNSNLKKSSDDWESVNFNSSTKHFTITTEPDDNNELISFKNDVTIFSITFTVLDTAKDGNTLIKLSNLRTCSKYDSENLENNTDVTTDDASVFVTIEKSGTATPTQGNSTATPTPSQSTATPTPAQSGTPTPTQTQNRTTPTPTKNTATPTPSKGSTAENKIKLPYAGEVNIIFVVAFVVGLIGVISFIGYKKLKNI